MTRKPLRFDNVRPLDGDLAALDAAALAMLDMIGPAPSGWTMPPAQRRAFSLLCHRCGGSFQVTRAVGYKGSLPKYCDACKRY